MRAFNLDSETGNTDSTDFTDFEEVIGHDRTNLFVAKRQGVGSAKLGAVTAADSERNAPPSVEHASRVIVARVTRIGNELHTDRELVALAHLKTVEELEYGLIPRGVATRNGE